MPEYIDPAIQAQRVTIVSGALPITSDVTIKDFATGNHLVIDSSGRITVLFGAGAAVDVTDRALRALGQVTTIAGSIIDVTDRGGRLLGHVTIDNATLAVTQSGTWTVQQGSPPWTADVTDRSGRLLGHVVSDTGSVTDVVDRAARLLGHVTVDNFPATQPVSGTIDVTDRSARLVGHVTVDNTTLAVTQSGTWTVQQGNPPWSTDITDRAARLLGQVTFPSGQPVNATPVLQRKLLDYQSRTDSNPVYVGTNTQGAKLTDTTWTVQKLFYDTTNRLIDSQLITGQWALRTALPWHIPDGDN